MKFTEEQLAKIKAAKTAEELIALAKAEGIEATEEQIKAQFDAMHKEGELADDELDNVAGGGCFFKSSYRAKHKKTGKLGTAAWVPLDGGTLYTFTSDDGTIKGKTCHALELEFLD